MRPCLVVGRCGRKIGGELLELALAEANIKGKIFQRLGYLLLATAHWIGGQDAINHFPAVGDVLLQRSANGLSNAVSWASRLLV